MIKVGQFMSSRLDVLPAEITRELEGLHDEVPAVDFALIRESAESELVLPLERAHDFADELSRAMFEQLFIHRFFHADPHPGNIFVTPANPERADYLYAGLGTHLY